MLAQKAKIPGFGHRVYTDGRSACDAPAPDVARLGLSSGQAKWFEYSKAIEEFINAEKKLNANVDFYSASTYHTLGIDVDLFTPIFAVSRIAGWTAHVMEQLADNRLIRPRAEYTGTGLSGEVDSDRRARVKHARKEVEKPGRAALRNAERCGWAFSLAARTASG